MSEPSPAARLIAQLDADWNEGKQLAVATDAHSYRDTVLIGIRRPRVSCVIDVPKREYDGVALMTLIGFEQAKPDPMQAARDAIKERSTTKKKELNHA